VGTATHAINQASASYGGNEHFLRALLGIKATGAAPQIGEDLLHRVLGIRPGPGETARQGPDETSELVHAFRDGALVTPGDAL
jgi:hypothetical protein